MELGTKVLFHDHPYQTSGSAWMDSVARDLKGAVFVTFSETIFYPQGGGQKGDRGEIFMSAEPESGRAPRQIRIVDTRKDNGIIRHYVLGDAALEAELTPWAGRIKVEYSLDWPFRFAQMRSHSASHLVHCHLQSVTGRSLPVPVSSPLDATGGYNLYDAVGLFTQAELAAAAERLNEFVAADHSISTYADEERGAGFRYWVCESWQIPCGGLHPRNTREIGKISMSMQEKKGNTKVRFQLL